jgi:copper chaperone CopZ
MSDSTTTVQVDGMTCGHCVSSVTEELEAIAGVEDVTVALNAGGTSEVTIRADRALAPEVISEAIAEAGYAVVAREA